MLKATLWSMKCVNIEGVKGSWKIGMNDAVELGDETYVRITPYNGGLVALVDLEGKRKTLQGTRGLVKLARLRNEAQVKDLQQEIEAEQPNCDLFAAAAPVAESRTPKVPKQKRERMKARRLAPEAVDVEVDFGEVEQGCIRMIRPVHTKDGLFIKYDEHNVAQTIRFLRQEGVEDAEQERYKRNQALPKGVWQRGDKLAVPYVEHGAKRTKTVTDLQSALAFQAELADHAGEADAEAESVEAEAE